jgi:hypothetical protein
MTLDKKIFGEKSNCDFLKYCLPIAFIFFGKMFRIHLVKPNELTIFQINTAYFNQSNFIILKLIDLVGFIIINPKKIHEERTVQKIQRILRH